MRSWEKGLSRIVMAGRVPATHALPVVQPPRRPHRPGVGGRDTPGHDGESHDGESHDGEGHGGESHDGGAMAAYAGHDGSAQTLPPRPPILMPMATPGRND